MSRRSIAELLAEEAESAEAHRDEDMGPGVRSRRLPKDPSGVYSVRIPVSRLERLRRVAERQHVAPSALIRAWVLERLDAEESGESMQVSRSELAQVVREQVDAALAQRKASLLAGKLGQGAMETVARERAGSAGKGTTAAWGHRLKMRRAVPARSIWRSGSSRRAWWMRRIS